MVALGEHYRMGHFPRTWKAQLSFKSQLKCHHLQEVFPACPFSLHSDPVQDAKRDSSASLLAFCTGLISTPWAFPWQCPGAAVQVLLLHSLYYIVISLFTSFYLQLTEHLGNRPIFYSLPCVQLLAQRSTKKCFLSWGGMWLCHASAFPPHSNKKASPYVNVVWNSEWIKTWWKLSLWKGRYNTV